VRLVLDRTLLWIYAVIS